jgi:hypothetical protein
MFSKVSFRTVAALVLVATFLALPVMAQERTQLRYFKTTDFGASWSDLTQAGDISTLLATNQGLPDFDALTMANNELCYAIWLNNTTAPGIYAVPGPSFTPVLAIPQGSDHFGIKGRAGGWSTLGRTPNGDLFIVAWVGAAADSSNKMIGVKSTNNGASWGTPFTIASTNLPAGALYPQISQMNSADWCFLIFVDENFEEYVMRFPTSGGAGTFVDLGATDEGSGGISYYIGSCQPIAYDPAANALYACHRAADLSAVAIYYSNNQGVSFETQSVAGTQRYPSMTLNTATQIPYTFSNHGIPADSGALHCAWYSHDEGYGQNLWGDPNDYACIVYTGGSQSVFYINQGYWWDANRGVSTNNFWAALTPDGLYTEYTTNGGTDWSTPERRYLDTEINLTNANNWGLTGGTDGVAYAFSCGRVAVPDLPPPSFSDVVLVTPTTDPGPWTITAVVTDAGNDTSDIHVTWFTPADSDTVNSPSSEFVITDPNTNSGTATFHLPANRPHGGAAYATGDTIWFYFWSRDLSGNNGRAPDMALIVGGEFLDVNEPPAGLVRTFALKGNYPNPFNPTTQIVFDLPGAAAVTLKVYNTMGQQVAVLADRQAMSQGRQRMTFDGANLPTGMYFYRLTAGPYSATSKMLLLK